MNDVMGMDVIDAFEDRADDGGHFFICEFEAGIPSFFYKVFKSTIPDDFHPQEDASVSLHKLINFDNVLMVNAG